jgi:hypothetical protein
MVASYREPNQTWLSFIAATCTFLGEKFSDDVLLILPLRNSITTCSFGGLDFLYFFSVDIGNRVRKKDFLGRMNEMK